MLSKKEKKRLKTDGTNLAQNWLKTLKSLAVAARMPFAREDGVLVQAMKNGHILLIDE